MEDKVESAAPGASSLSTLEGAFLYPTRDQNLTCEPTRPHGGVDARPCVLVAGAGALGCAAARTLAADGGVDLVLVDDDVVELSNLQRQVLYTEADLGRPKVEAAADRLRADFGARVRPVRARLDAATAPSLFAGIDLVLEGTDDPAAKFRIGRLAGEAALPCVHGGVARTGGQWLLVDPGVSACLSCVFPAPAATAESREDAAGCSALGILAPVAGVVGAMQALQALAFLRRPGRAVAGRLHVYDLGGRRSRHLDVPADPRCSCGAARHAARPGQRQPLPAAVQAAALA